MSKPKPTVSVDMAAELQKVHLKEHFPVKIWPNTLAVRQLATWAKTAKKYHGEKAYVFIDLKRSVHRGIILFFSIHMN